MKPKKRKTKWRQREVQRTKEKLENSIAEEKGRSNADDQQISLRQETVQYNRPKQKIYLSSKTDNITGDCRTESNRLTIKTKTKVDNSEFDLEI